MFRLLPVVMMKPANHFAIPNREGRVPRVPNLLTTVLSLALSAILPLSARAQIQQAWVERYNNGILTGTNQAVKIALDSAGDIYVLGFSQNTNNTSGYLTAK